VTVVGLLRTPRWIALTVVAIVVSGAFCFAGWWQGTRTLDIVAAEEAALSVPIPVSDAAGIDLPNASIGRPVLVRGSYIAQEQRLVASREFEGRPGFLVVTPVDVDGLRVPVVRGWVPDVADPGVEVPAGEVTVTGVLQPYEEFYVAAPVRPDGTLLAISPTALDWPEPILGGFVVLTGQVPDGAAAPAPVPATISAAGAGFPLQNAAYTLQWIVFAGVVWLIWLRWLRLDLRAANDVDSLAA
jgi:cytochrome oxidase assembly protein ShyY1